MSSAELWGRENHLCFQETFIEELNLGAEYKNGCMDDKGKCYFLQFVENEEVETEQRIGQWLRSTVKTKGREERPLEGLVKVFVLSIELWPGVGHRPIALATSS